MYTDYTCDHNQSLKTGRVIVIHVGHASTCTCTCTYMYIVYRHLICRDIHKPVYVYTSIKIYMYMTVYYNKQRILVYTCTCT